VIGSGWFPKGSWPSSNLSRSVDSRSAFRPSSRRSAASGTESESSSKLTYLPLLNPMDVALFVFFVVVLGWFNQHLDRSGRERTFNLGVEVASR
jgi:hypothetical protein